MVDYKVKDEELENQTIDENGNNNELNDENNDIDKVDENINKEEVIDNKEIRNFDLGLNDKIGYNLWDTIIKGV